MSGIEPVSVPRIVALGAPVLCFDTCTALDLMRDPTRQTVLAHERAAALDLLAAAERSSDLVILMADQVASEYAENAPTVEDEARKALLKLKAQIKRIDSVATVYGSSGRANLDHLDDHVTRARAIVERWIKATTPARQNTDVVSRAYARVTQARTPARKGKDSMKDCVVVETYLDIVRQLRGAGLASKIVFVSSNTDDYTAASKVTPKPDLGQEFDALNLAYAPNLAAAKFMLGL